MLWAKKWKLNNKNSTKLPIFLNPQVMPSILVDMSLVDIQVDESGWINLIITRFNLMI